MKKSGVVFILFFVWISFKLIAAPYNSLMLSNLKCQNLNEPAGLIDPNPSLSWNLVCTDFKRKNIRQTAYQIIVSSSLERLNQNFGDLWDSEMVRSSVMTNIQYKGKGFRSSRKYWWKVRIWDNLNKTSQWSEPATFITGILRPSDWQAQWIGSDLNHTNLLFRKEFEIKKNLKQAILHITSNNFYDIRVNGNRNGDELLLNGNSFFSNALEYKTFDLSEKLWKGINTLAISTYTYSSSESTRIFAQLHLIFDDGSVEIIASEKLWMVRAGPIVTDEMGGEMMDANQYPKSWDKAFFTEDMHWHRSSVHHDEAPIPGVLPSFMSKTVQTVKDKAKWNNNTLVFDLGKLSLVLPSIRISGNTSSRVEITPLEDIVIQKTVAEDKSYLPFLSAPDNTVSELWEQQYMIKKSRIFPDSLTRARIFKDIAKFKKWTYTLKGGSDELFKARFSPKACRYLMVQLYPAPSDTMLPKLKDIEADRVEPGFEKTGEFYSSNESLDFNYDSVTQSLDNWLVESYLTKTSGKVVDWSDLIRYSSSFVYHKNYVPLISEYLVSANNNEDVLKQAWMNYLFTSNTTDLYLYYPRISDLVNQTELKLLEDSLRKDSSLARLTELFYRSANTTRNFVESSKWEYRNIAFRKLYGFSKADSLSNRFGRMYNSQLDFPVDSAEMIKKLPEICISQTAGIGVDDYGRGAGFKKFLIKPVFLEDVTQVSAAYVSASGYVSVSWKLLLSKLSIDVSVPPNTQALLHIPTDIDKDFREKGIPNEQSLNVRHYGEIEGYTIYELDSGNYGFLLTLPENNSMVIKQLERIGANK